MNYYRILGLFLASMLISQIVYAKQDWSSTAKLKPGVIAWTKEQSSKIKTVNDTTLIIAGPVTLKPGDIFIADGGLYKVKEINRKSDDETIIVYEAPKMDDVFAELSFGGKIDMKNMTLEPEP